MDDRFRFEEAPAIQVGDTTDDSGRVESLTDYRPDGILEARRLDGRD